MNNKKPKKVAILIGILIILSSQIVFAATTWSNPYTVTLNAADDYWHNNYSIGNTKTTTATYYTVYNISQTMTFNPSVRMINSNGEVRGSVMNMPNVGYQKTGSNTGTVGYVYYASTKPDLLQTEDGSLRLQFKSE